MHDSSAVCCPAQVQSRPCGVATSVKFNRRTKSWPRSHLQLPLASQVLRLPFCPSATGRLTAHPAQALTQTPIILCDLKFSS